MMRAWTERCEPCLRTITLALQRTNKLGYMPACWLSRRTQPGLRTMERQPLVLGQTVGQPVGKPESLPVSLRIVIENSCWSFRIYNSPIGRSTLQYQLRRRSIRGRAGQIHRTRLILPEATRRLDLL